MWDFMIKNMNDNILPQLTSCIFVGDAAGRKAIEYIRKQDHSDFD